MILFQFVTPIYTQQTNKLPSRANQFVRNDVLQDTTQDFENTKFFSLSEGIRQTDKQAEIREETEPRPFDELVGEAMAELEGDVQDEEG
ncbi:hypothetical protein KKC52_13495 [bacterium]|nr:hypothetical protein [bacterium]